MGNLSFEEQSKWRKNISEAIKTEGCDSEKKASIFNPVNYYNFEINSHKSEKEIMEFDLYNLRNSNLVIVNFNDEKSIGTAMELMIAKEYNIPIIAFGTKDKQIHPWLIESCTRVCDDMREVVDHIIQFYLN